MVDGTHLKTVPQITGRIEGSGTRFELTDSDYLNVTLKSNEPVNLTLESVPEMVVMNLEAAEAGGFGKDNSQRLFILDYLL